MSSERDVVSRRGFIRGAAGATAAAGAAGTASAQEEGGSESGSGETKTVEVAPGGNLKFDPEELKVTPGTTVKWVWQGGGHNVVAESTPEDADWQGTEGGADQLYDEGYEYSHTFETLGTYEYVCTPHKSAGMVGTVEVVESISTPTEASVPKVPNSAKTLGVATTFSMIATLGLAFFFIKYGGDYDVEEE
ncbi:MAG: plastocyanin/azurin family copper-binding protein [Halolamina sp.]